MQINNNTTKQPRNATRIGHRVTTITQPQNKVIPELIRQKNAFFSTLSHAIDATLEIHPLQKYFTDHPGKDTIDQLPKYFKKAIEEDLNINDRFIQLRNQVQEALMPLIGTPLEPKLALWSGDTAKSFLRENSDYFIDTDIFGSSNLMNQATTNENFKYKIDLVKSLVSLILLTYNKD